MGSERWHATQAPTPRVKCPAGLALSISAGYRVKNLGWPPWGEPVAVAERFPWLVRTRIRNRSDGRARRPVVATIATAVAGCLAAVVAVLTLTGVAVPAPSRSINYCQAIPFVTVTPEMWGFHAGHAI